MIVHYLNWLIDIVHDEDVASLAQFLDLLFDIQHTGPVRGFTNSNPA
jgi:hypothetical protein